MGNISSTYQQRMNVSVNREKIVDIATNLNLSKKDLRVLLLLLTQLDGYVPPKNQRSDTKDPMNFKKIDYKTLAETLNISKREVKSSVASLWNEEYLEQGSNDTVKDGYRFTF